MGKANKVKFELRDAIEMVYLIQVLKDIADNKFFMLLSDKEKFRRFGETFVEFFRMISLTRTKHFLMSNDCKKVAILVITIEGSFLGKFNNKILRAAVKVKDRYEDFEFIAVGNKAIDRLKAYTPDLKMFSGMESKGMYNMAVEIKDYLVDRIMKGEIGKVVVVYCWSKSFDSQKARVIPLLPCEDLVSKQTEFVDAFENVIEESDSKDIIGYLANLWVTVRLHEIFIDSNIASAAALAAFLDDSVDKMKKEQAKTAIKYRKVKKSDIDKSLRETFSARMMSMK
ncbi:MAG: FoF1 ATP synthase subunit gamma [Candidatus Zapsychrus exili]|nr:FoF1 ATP synthase subunit gamma [Candidatus Zapsychrus exili]